jgi:hypothetical protein
VSRYCHCPIVTQSLDQLIERQSRLATKPPRHLSNKYRVNRHLRDFRPTQWRNIAGSPATLFYRCFDRIYFGVDGSYLGIDVACTTPTVCAYRRVFNSSTRGHALRSTRYELLRLVLQRQLRFSEMQEIGHIRGMIEFALPPCRFVTARIWPHARST